MRLDHVIYGTTDLDAAAARVEAALGLAVQPGGHHDGQGSHNRIVPLGPGYLELLAIDDPRKRRPRRSAGSCRRSSPATACWPTPSSSTTSSLGLDDVHTVSRDGLTASVAGVEEALREPFLPFFVASDRRARGRPARA